MSKIESVIGYERGISKDTSVYTVTHVNGERDHWDKRGTSAFTYGVVQDRLRQMLGKVLTVIDASYTNERQLKAVKDIIRKEFATEMGELWEMSEPKYQEIIDASTEDLTEEELEESAISLEEALGA